MRGKKSKKENEKIWEKFIRVGGVVGGLCERCWPVGKWDGGGMQRAYREGKGEGEKDNEEEVEGGRDEKETE